MTNSRDSSSHNLPALGYLRDTLPLTKKKLTIEERLEAMERAQSQSNHELERVHCELRKVRKCLEEKKARRTSDLDDTTEVREEDAASS